MDIEQLLANLLSGILIAATPIIIGIVASALVLLKAWIDKQIENLESQTMQNVLGMLSQHTYNLVHAAAQELVHNTEKKNWVFLHLRNIANNLEVQFGVEISDGDIDRLIEGIYHQIKENL